MNLALRGLPTFSCLPQPVGQHRTTTHLLPDEDVIDVSMDQVDASLRSKSIMRGLRHHAQCAPDVCVM